MPYTPPAPQIPDGPPGLEGLWLIQPGSIYPSLTLNDWMDPATGREYLFSAKAAYSRLQKIQGIYNKSDADDPRTNLNFQFGEFAFPRLPRGRTVVFSGTIYAKTLHDLRAQIAKLKAASESNLTNPSSGEPGGGWGLKGFYNSTYDTAGLNAWCSGVPIALTIDEIQGSGDSAPSPWSRGFDFTFRMSDPRFWFPDFTVALGSSGSPKGSGTSGVMVMAGTAPSEPIFHIKGGGSATLTLAHAELGLTMELDLAAAMASGDVLEIDFTSRLITLFPAGMGAEVDYSGYVNWSVTDWWHEQGASMVANGGNNTLTVTGGSWWATSDPAVW